jgi:endonuclease/exonuclease/phosphatase family metal-dependent hydrolase
MLRSFIAFVALACACALPAPAETITLATYNVEHFEDHFEGFEQSKKPEARQPGLVKDLVDALRKSNDEDNWEVARVITHKAFNPDVLVIQEGCNQDNLEYFNKRWLQNAYETVIVFPSNTDREQQLGMLLKPGFKLLERRDKYHLEKDTVPNERGDLLFARGPAFALVQTPGGYKFWVGVTHQKSKSDNSVDVTAWRNREAVRTHQIMKELAAQGPDDVILLGDMNDELGEDQFEKDPKSGGDAIANLVGPAPDGFVLVTEALARSGKESFGGYWNPRFRSFIDHVVATPSMKDQIEQVDVFYGSLAPAASDHFPVFVKVRSDAPAGADAAPKAVEKPAAPP